MISWVGNGGSGVNGGRGGEPTQLPTAAVLLVAGSLLSIEMMSRKAAWLILVFRRAIWRGWFGKMATLEKIVLVL